MIQYKVLHDITSNIATNGFILNFSDDKCVENNQNRSRVNKPLELHHHESPPPLLQLADPGYIFTVDEVSEVRLHLLGPGYLPDPLLLFGRSFLLAAERDEAVTEILPEHREHDQIKPGIRVAEHVHGVFNEVQVLEFPDVENVHF